MNEPQSQQIIDLQMRVAFQEEALQNMSEQMTALTQELQLASKQIHLLSDKIKNNATNINDGNNRSVSERPPHY